MSDLISLLIVIVIIRFFFGLIGKFFRAIAEITEAEAQRQKLLRTSSGSGQPIASLSHQGRDKGRKSQAWWKDESHTSLAYRSKGKADMAMKIIATDYPGLQGLTELRAAQRNTSEGSQANLFYASLLESLTLTLRDQATARAPRTVSDSSAPSVSTSTGSQANHIMRALKNPNSIREAVIVSEILKRPNV